MASSELERMLRRRSEIIERAEADAAAAESSKLPASERPSPALSNSTAAVATQPANNPFNEFRELSRKQIQKCQTMFNSFDTNKDKFIDFEELKRMMEKVGSPQTHLALKAMIREVDEDGDNRINFREFLLIFRKALAGELSEDSGLYDIYCLMAEIDVQKEGVKGAKNFFEAKIEDQTKLSRFEQEIRDEQEERRRAEEDKRRRRIAFKNAADIFKQLH